MAAALCLPLSLGAQSRRADDLGVGKLLVAPRDCPDPTFANDCDPAGELRRGWRGGAHHQSPHQSADLARTRATESGQSSLGPDVHGRSGGFVRDSGPASTPAPSPRTHGGFWATCIWFPRGPCWRKLWREAPVRTSFTLTRVIADGPRDNCRVKWLRESGTFSTARRTGFSIPIQRRCGRA